MKKYVKRIYRVHFEVAEPGRKVYNHLEDASYITDADKCVIITGGEGEQWPVDKETFIKKYEVDTDLEQGVTGIATTKSDPNGVFAEQCTQEQEVVTSWGDTLKAKVGSYIIYNNKNDLPDEEDRWVVDKDVFNRTYEEV